MPTKKLTAKGIAALAYIPNEKGERTRYIDSTHPGLAVMVHPSGARSWSYRYWLNGKQRNAGLGSFPATGLSAARTAARKIDEQVAKGEDPRDEQSVIHGLDCRVEVAVEAWLSACEADGIKRKTIVNRRSGFRCHLLPTLKGRTLDRVSYVEFETLVAGVERRARATGVSLRKWLPSFTRWAAKSGFYGATRDARERNPLRGGWDETAQLPAARTRAIGFDLLGEVDAPEVAVFVTACLKLIESGEPLGRLPLLLLLTGARRHELWNALVDEYDPLGGKLHVCGLRGGSKKQPAHTLILPPMARALLDAQLALARQQGYSRTFRRRDPATGDEVTVTMPALFLSRGIPALKRKLDAAMAEVAGSRPRKFVLHDLRRSFRSHLTALGVDPAVAESLLNHRRRNEVEATYDVAARTEARRVALVAFEDFVRRVAGLNVVEFKRTTG